MQIKTKWLIPTLLILPPVFLLSHALFSHNTFFYRDYWQTVYPNLKWATEVAKTGTFPLWNPYLCSGYPIFATMTYGFFYPPAILFLLFPLIEALEVFLLLHLIWAAIGMYLLCREWQIFPWAAVFAGLIFSLSGPMVGGLNNYSYMSTPSWTPWALLCFVKSLKNYRWWPATSVVMALMALSGEPQTCYNTGLIFVFFLISQSKSLKKIRLAIGILTLITILALLLAAVQILPALELGINSDRALGVKAEHAFHFSFYFEDLGRFWVPFIYGNPTQIWWGRISHHEVPFQSSVYIGLLPLLFAFLGFFAPQQKRLKIFWLGSFLFFFLGSFAKEIPVFKVLRHLLPLWDSFRYGEKLISPAVFMLAIGAAIGAEYFLFQKEKKKIIVLTVIAIFPVLLVLWLTPIANLPDAYSYRQKLFFPAIFTMLAVFAAVILGLSLKKNLYICLVFYFTICIDLFFYNSQIIPTVEKSFYKCPKSLASFVANKKYRISIAEEHLHLVRGKNILPSVYQHRDQGVGNLPCVYNVRKDWGYVPAFLKPYSLLRWEAKNNANLLARMAVTNAKQFFNIKARPRYSLIYNIVSIKTTKDAIESMKILPKETGVVLQQQGVLTSLSPSPGKLQILYSSTNKEIFEVETIKPAYLLLAENYYPGWKAYVGEKQAKIWQVDLAFKLVYIPAGKHRVEFSYFPTSFYLGMSISCVFWLIVCCYFFYTFLFFWRRS